MGNMSQKNIKDYEKFLDEFKIAFAKHEKRCEERRRRGIHDLNIFDVLETKEVKKIYEFVIVLDTSYSIDENLAKRFISNTYSILSTSNMFS